MAVRAWLGVHWEYPQDLTEHQEPFVAVVVIDELEERLTVARYEDGKWYSLYDGERAERLKRATKADGYHEVVAFYRIPVPAIQNERNELCEFLRMEKRHYIMALPFVETPSREAEPFETKDDRIRPLVGRVRAFRVSVVEHPSR